MRSSLIIFLGSFIIFFAAGCGSSSNFESCCAGDTVFSYKETTIIPGVSIDSSVVNTSFFENSFQQNGYYANFGFQFIQRDSTIFVCFMNAAKTALIISAIGLEEKIFVSDVSGIISRKDRLCNKIIGDTLHLITTDKFEYGKYHFDTAFQLHAVQKVNLKKEFPKHSFINSNTILNKKIAYSYPYLFIPYGRYGTLNEVDKKAGMRIDVRDGSSEKMLEYPAKYNTCPDRYMYPVVDVVNEKLYSLFLNDDYIYKTNIMTGETESATPISFTSHYMCFDEKQEENLAYANKYDLNNEMNINFIYNNDQFYIIKRLRKRDKKQPARCVILVFNKSLEYQFAFYPQHDVFPSASLAYKQGVLIFAHKLNEAYYYAFNKAK